MKKIIAAFLLAVFVLTFACSCGGNEPQNESSNPTATESSSTITTSSEIESETESKKPQENSSKKENNTSKNPTTSKAPVVRPGSTTQSQSVKIAPLDRKSVVFCGMSTGTANSYGETREDAFKEIEDVAAAGYMNAMSDRGLFKYDKYWDIIIKYDMTIWYSAFAVYNSKKQTIDEYMEGLYDIVDNYIKPYPERWERFHGFWYDEKIWRGETNADFVTVTKTLYQKYGKRNYAVVATGEISGIEGNEDLIGTSADDMNKMLGSSFKYVTDAAFDSYGIDVREGALNNNIADRYKDEMPGIYDGKSYYREYTALLKRLVGHDFNLWYLPCAYTCTVSGGLDGIKKADEEYCLAHLNFFHEELKQQQYAGGLMLYVYGLSKKSEDGGTRGLKYHLAVEAPIDSDQTYKIHPEYPKWKKYSKRLREIVEEYNLEKANILRKL